MSTFWLITDYKVLGFPDFSKLSNLFSRTIHFINLILGISIIWPKYKECPPPPYSNFNRFVKMYPALRKRHKFNSHSVEANKTAIPIKVPGPSWRNIALEQDPAHYPNKQTVGHGQQNNCCWELFQMSNNTLFKREIVFNLCWSCRSLFTHSKSNYLLKFSKL